MNNKKNSSILTKMSDYFIKRDIIIDCILLYS